jgi:hypothetical protein
MDVVEFDRSPVVRRTDIGEAEMTLQTITLRLPDMIYRQVERRAQRTRRPVEDELVAVVSSALPALDDLPADIADEMAQLGYLTDAELWQAARAALPLSDSERMQALLLKRQRDGLSAAEEREAKRLAHRADRIMLVRSQAAALLQDRGHDASNLRPAKAMA